MDSRLGSWVAPRAYSQTILEMWDEPTENLYRNHLPTMTDFDDFMVSDKTVMYIPANDFTEEFLATSAFSEYEKSLIRASAFYTAAEPVTEVFTSFANMSWEDKLLDAKFLCHSFLAHGDQYWDWDSENKYLIPSFEYTNAEALWDVVEKEKLTPQMISVSMRGRYHIASTLYNDDSDPLCGTVTTVGEMAFVIARFPGVFRALSGKAWIHNPVRNAEALEVFRPYCGEETLAWFMCMRMSTEMSALDDINRDFLNSVESIKSAGISFDEAVPLMVAGIQDGGVMRAIIDSGVDVDLASSLT